MSETSSEPPPPSADVKRYNDQFWADEKRLYFTDYLKPIYPWTLAKACILLLEGEDLVWVQMLMLNYEPDVIVSEEFGQNTLARELKLSCEPSKPNPLRKAYSEAIKAIHTQKLPASKKHETYSVLPSVFLRWADEKHRLPNELFDEKKRQYNWDGAGYTVNERLFVQKLFDHLLHNGEKFRSGLGRIKVATLVEDMVKQGHWPDGMEIPKNKRHWIELATDLLAVYHEIDQAKF